MSLLALFKAVVLIQMVAASARANTLQSDGVTCTATCEMCWTVRSNGGSIISPDYPNDYGNNRDCEVTIEAPVGKQIDVTFSQFVVESCCDLVTVSDGTSTPYLKLSGNHSLASVSVPSNVVKIQFTTNEDNSSLLSDNLGPGGWLARFTIL